VKWIPVASTTVKTGLTVAQAIDRLRQIAAPRRLFQSKRSGKDFEGAVHESGIRLSPTYMLLNLPGILPVIHGRFDHGTDTATVILEQVPHPAMMSVNMGLFAFVGLCVYDILPYPVPTVLGIVCVAWLLMIFGFWLDRGRSLKKLVAALSESSDERLHGTGKVTG
jgi:hypothetical protein